MNIIVFSPHPDDAELMLGGTIAKYTQKGHDVQIVLVTLPNKRERRMEESKMAAEILGARLSILDLNPYELVFNRKLVEIFDGVLGDFPPDIIYTSWVHDSHQDHVNVAKATIATARKNNCSLYMYDQMLTSGFTPYTFRAEAFVDISDTVEIKIKSILAYESQFPNFDEKGIQWILSKASYLGLWLNVKHAEAFEVVKEIIKI